MSMIKIRKALRARFGERQYRITADGQVHFGADGVWKFYGWLSEVVSEIERGML